MVLKLNPGLHTCYTGSLPIEQKYPTQNILLLHCTEHMHNVFSCSPSGSIASPTSDIDRCQESSKDRPSAQRMGQAVTASGCGFLVWEGVLELSPENAERTAIVLSSALLQSSFSYRFICLNLFVVFRIFPVLMSLLNV